jgi:hypothetical protein
VLSALLLLCAIRLPDPMLRLSPRSLRVVLALGLLALCLTVAAPVAAARRHHSHAASPRRPSAVPVPGAVPEKESDKAAPPTPQGEGCLGEFELCASGECVLNRLECGSCAKGQYRCPLSTTCVDSAAAYMSCPNLAGTHLDWNLDTEVRIDMLLAVMPINEQILQLQNNAPAAPDVGLPAYNCQQQSSA